MFTLGSGEDEREMAQYKRERHFACSPMFRAQQPGLLVHVADRTEVAAHDFEVCALADVVDGHFEHAQMEVGDWGEGAASDEDDGLLGGVAERALEPVVRKHIVCRGPSRAHREQRRGGCMDGDGSRS